MDNLDGQFQILESFKEKITATWGSPNVENFRECLLFVRDFSIWVDCLKNTPQSILFDSALNECATANLFCSQGLYKHAMISLRLCLEHCLYAIYMSSNQVNTHKQQQRQHFSFALLEHRQYILLL